MASDGGRDQDTDVVVVGAGLSGLRCALALREAGLDVLVLEAGDAPGGRIRTDVVDGFRVDRGFQLLNPAYPAVGRWIDVPALGLQSFAAGVAARTDTGLTRFANPLREPSLLATTAGAGLRRPRELVATARWARALATPRRGRTLSQVLALDGDRDLGSALDAARLDGLLRTVLERFFAGVLLEDEQATSNSYALLLTWMFAKGVPGLPREGMQALPQQLADVLGDRVRLGSPVDGVNGTAGGVEIGVAGEVLRARAVVVAAGAAEAEQLLGVDVPATKGVVTTWWAADEAPSDSALLHVEGRAGSSGPVVNCAVVSNAAPSYAPAGRHLVQASALMGPGRPPPGEDVVRRHAGELLGASTSGWRELVRHEVPHALPAQPTPYSARRPVDLGNGVFVCGDHRDTASIQGALVSGQRAADAVLASLA